MRCRVEEEQPRGKRDGTLRTVPPFEKHQIQATWYRKLVLQGRGWAGGGFQPVSAACNRPLDLSLRDTHQKLETWLTKGGRCMDVGRATGLHGCR